MLGKIAAKYSLWVYLDPSYELPPQVELVRMSSHRYTLRMIAKMETAESGHLLLEIEKNMKLSGDPRAEVFLEPSADSSKLRAKLRGVKIASGS